MIEVLLDKYILYVLMGVAFVMGVVGKVIVSVSLRRLLKGAGSMGKSAHPLMRLVRAKFEHACMISETVENVQVFVDKFLYEYKVAGMRLRSWQRLEAAMIGTCLIVGGLGAFFSYNVYGAQDVVLRYGATGIVLAFVLFVLRKMTDEVYRLEMVRNYMVDYLENVCLHRYEKNYEKNQEKTLVKNIITEPEFMKDSNISDKKRNDEQEPTRPHPGREVPSPRTSPEIEPPTMPKPYDVPDIQIQAIEKEKPPKEKKEDKPQKEVLIRQILEEFMA